MPQKYIFKIDTHNEIIISVPPFKKKFNYYYETTKRLHKFDEATVFYKGENFKKILTKDIIQEILARLYGDFKNLLSNKLELPQSIELGKFGEAYNRDTCELSQDGDSYIQKEGKNCFDDYVIFSVHHIATSVYSFKSILYLEIGPTYPWFGYDDDPLVLPFEMFARSYRPYVLVTLDPKSIKEWIVFLEALIKKLDICL